jgi:hypothetical protein
MSDETLVLALMIVADSPMLLITYSMAARKAGWRVWEVRDCRLALTVVSNHRIDALLLCDTTPHIALDELIAHFGERRPGGFLSFVQSCSRQVVEFGPGPKAEMSKAGFELVLQAADRHLSRSSEQ